MRRSFVTSGFPASAVVGSASEGSGRQRSVRPSWCKRTSRAPSYSPCHRARLARPRRGRGRRRGRSRSLPRAFGPYVRRLGEDVAATCARGSARARNPARLSDPPMIRRAAFTASSCWSVSTPKAGERRAPGSEACVPPCSCERFTTALGAPAAAAWGRPCPPRRRRRRQPPERTDDP